MNDFTKEELKEILACVCNIDGKVLKKLQSMIDSYQSQEEVFTSNSSLSLESTYFYGTQCLDSDDILPIMHALSRKLNQKITSAGIYNFELKVVKLESKKIYEPEEILVEENNHDTKNAL